MAGTARTARTEALRGVLDVALAVARAIERDGHGDVPGPLRPHLKMTRTGSRARAAADQAGDDETFRALVAEAVDADELDPAGRLWLTRPDGWEAELDALVAEHRARAAEGDARRALGRERRGRERAEQERDDLRSEVARLDAEARSARRAATEAEARATTAEETAARVAAERQEAVRQLKDMEARYQAALAERRTLEAELAAARDHPAPTEVPAPTEPPTPPTPPVPPAAPPEAALDRAAAAGAVDAASTAATALGEALDRLSTLLRPAVDEAPAAPGPPTGPAPRDPRPAPPRRRPPPIPGGLHDDSAEAADALVRLPGCVLFVDGYNATLGTWPGEELPTQRRRLVDALDRLEARLGLDVTVVFDGVEEQVRRSASRRVHVQFTPVGVEADDVILDLVDRVEAGRPVLVASDDERVRAGARRRGARPIAVAQLRAVLT